MQCELNLEWLHAEKQELKQMDKKISIFWKKRMTVSDPYEVRLQKDKVSSSNLYQNVPCSFSRFLGGDHFIPTQWHSDDADWEKGHSGACRLKPFISSSHLLHELQNMHCKCHVHTLLCCLFHRSWPLFHSQKMGRRQGACLNTSTSYATG